MSTSQAAAGPRGVTRDNRAYPTRLATCLGGEAPRRLEILPAQQALPWQQDSLLALVCSARAPAGVLLGVHDLAQRWRHGRQTIVSGFHAPVEQEAFTVLLRGPGRIVYCPARSLPKRLKPEWRTALDAGHLSIVSPFPATVRRATKEAARARNRFVAALADAVLIAYAHPGSSTAQLAQEALDWGKRVYRLDHPANDHLAMHPIPPYHLE